MKLGSVRISTGLLNNGLVEMFLDEVDIQKLKIDRTSHSLIVTGVHDEFDDIEETDTIPEYSVIYENPTGESVDLKRTIAKQEYVHHPLTFNKRGTSGDIL